MTLRIKINDEHRHDQALAVISAAKKQASRCNAGWPVFDKKDRAA
jgi:hypothetical protein